MWHTKQAISWLNIFISERLSSDLELEYLNSELRLINRNTPLSYIVFSSINSMYAMPGEKLPCAFWVPSIEGFEPVIKDSLPLPGYIHPPAKMMKQASGIAYFNFDLFGFIYWMLNRIEEIGVTSEDIHSRFLGKDAHAYKFGYLDRPIVDEWIIIFCQVLKRVWPSLHLKEFNFSIEVSHDVDVPSLYAFKSIKKKARGAIVRLLKYGDFKGGVLGFFSSIFFKGEISNLDPFNTFNWIFEQSKIHNLVNTFYFISGRTNKEKDADYEVDDNAIINLIKMIKANGHNVGLHPSYDTYKSDELLSLEHHRLLNILESEFQSDVSIGARMHYLRWEHPTTLQILNDIGLEYDSTMTFADFPGFRCGTCYDFLGFNPLLDRLLLIRVKPLIVMEGTIIDKRYMGLGYGRESINKFLELKSNCKKVNGKFSILWHNCHLSTSKDRLLYSMCLSE